MITVQIFYMSTGKPAEIVKTGLSFNGMFRGGTEYQWTDSNGEAHFDCEPGDGKVYVGASMAHQGYLAGRVIVYI
jgi:hypothetical protein